MIKPVHFRFVLLGARVTKMGLELHSALRVQESAEDVKGEQPNKYSERENTHPQLESFPFSFY